MFIFPYEFGPVATQPPTFILSFLLLITGSARRSLCIVGPPAELTAASTPPPPKPMTFAAFTIAE